MSEDVEESAFTQQPDFFHWTNEEVNQYVAEQNVNGEALATFSQYRPNQGLF
jgi:hypothetical protein